MRSVDSERDDSDMRLSAEGGNDAVVRHPFGSLLIAFCRARISADIFIDPSRGVFVDDLPSLLLDSQGRLRAHLQTSIATHVLGSFGRSPASNLIADHRAVCRM